MRRRCQGRQFVTSSHSPGPRQRLPLYDIILASPERLRVRGPGLEIQPQQLSGPALINAVPNAGDRNNMTSTDQTRLQDSLISQKHRAIRPHLRAGLDFRQGQDLSPVRASGVGASPPDLPERDQAYDLARDRANIRVSVLSPTGLDRQIGHASAT
jgi:hypothetical protein